MKTNAFTLAEVLITLGIVGVVAVMTMPTVIKHHQQQVTVNRLKHTYSTLSQAIKLSETENGFVKEWDEARSIGIETWLNRYLLPYIKYNSKYKSGSDTNIKLTNGIVLKFIPDQTQVQVGVYLNGNFGNTHAGRDYFVFFIGYPPTSAKDRIFKDSNSPIIPYDYISGPVDLSRTKRYYISNFSCNKNNKYGCAALIMLDGWKISKDYPW